MAEKFYTTPEIVSLHPVLQRKGYRWLVRQIRKGKLLVVDTNPGGQPRWIARESDIVAFLDKLVNG